MRILRRAFVVLCSCLTVGLLVGPVASSADDPPVTDDPDVHVYSPEEGVPNAPEGSCLDDATQPKCGDITMIVMTGEIFNPETDSYDYDPSDSEDPAPVDGDLNAYRSPASSSLADYDPGTDEQTDFAPLDDGHARPDGTQEFACHVHSNHPEVARGTSPDHAKATGKNICVTDPRVGPSELWENLFKKSTDGSWVLKDHDYDSRATPGRLEVVSEKNCLNDDFRTWGAQAVATAEVGGVLYGDTNPRHQLKGKIMDCNA